MRGIILASRALILLYHLPHSLSHPPLHPFRISYLLVSLITLLSMRKTRSHQLLILRERSLLLISLSLLVASLILLLFYLFLPFLLLLLHLPSILKMTRTSLFLQQSNHYLLLILDNITHLFYLLILYLLENALGGLYIMVFLPHLLLLLPLSLDILFQLYSTLHLHLHLLAHPLLLQLPYRHSLPDTRPDTT